MAILSGHQGLRGFSRFAEHNAAELTAALELKHGRAELRHLSKLP